MIALRLLRACTHAHGCCLRSLQGTQEFLKRRHIFTAERLKNQGSGIFIYLYFYPKGIMLLVRVWLLSFLAPVL